MKNPVIYIVFGLLLCAIGASRCLAQIDNASDSERLNANLTELFQRKITGQTLPGFEYTSASARVVFRRSGFGVGLLIPTGVNGPTLERWQYGSTWITRSGRELWSDQPRPIDYLDINLLPGVTATLAEQGGSTALCGGTGLNHAGLAGFNCQKPGLSYRKSYHFFDLGYVVILSGLNVNGETGSAVTTINQQVTPMPLMDIHLSNDQLLTEINQPVSINDIHYAWLDGMGYVFPQPVRLTIKRDRKLTTLYIEHDKASDQSLACIILPDITLKRLKHFVKQPTVRVVGQDERYHALEDLVDNAMSYFFWQGSSAGPVRVDQPAAVYCRKDQRGLAIALGNPMARASQITLEIDHPADIAALGPHATLQRQGNTAAITFNAQPGHTHHAGLGGIVP